MQQPEFVYDSTGKITGYKTQGGADTVFPFSNLVKVEGDFTVSRNAKVCATEIADWSKTVTFKNVPTFGAYISSGSSGGLGVGFVTALTKESCTFYVINRANEPMTQTCHWVAVGEV